MVRIIEIKETLLDSALVENIYKIKDLTERIIEELELQRELNKDDYNYLEIILDKTKTNLQKSYMLLKL
ncbi:MAG: hypothetical protein MR598_07605 [Erysipelotrichaceae bacterium]|nr:hypothetical protein [Erysipelotrichaceae bacterium]